VVVGADFAARLDPLREAHSWSTYDSPGWHAARAYLVQASGAAVALQALLHDASDGAEHVSFVFETYR
jgi:hypothetical protein